MVRLEDVIFQVKVVVVASFNSKMVRLEVPEIRLRAMNAETSFNSKMVRLEDHPQQLRARAIPVSIPKWYD